MHREHYPTPEEIWLGDWKVRHLERIKATGASTVTDFLQKHPAEPYAKLSRRLGGYVAPLQLLILQFDEALPAGRARETLKDVLVRDLNTFQKRGWERGGLWPRNHARAQAEFIQDTKKFLGSEAGERAEKIVDALDSLPPPRGWMPISISDPLIEKAFEIGWPRGDSITVAENGREV